MGLLARLFGRPRADAEAAKERRLWLQDPRGWSIFGGRQSHSGKSVTINSALNLATVWACVKLTSQAVAGLPLQLFQRDGDNGREPLPLDPLAHLISVQPNADTTANEFWEGAVAWLCTDGNAYAEKLMAGGALAGLSLLPSNCVAPYRTENNALRYRVTLHGERRDLPRDRMFHVRAFGLGGDLGLSPISYGVQTLGDAMATDETVGKIFANGLQSSGLLSVAAPLNNEQADQVEQRMEKFVGSSRAGKLLVLGSGMKYETLQMNLDDAQMLETRRFAVEEICRWFGVPPIMIGHAAQGQTMWGSGVEQILIAWLTLGLNPFLKRIEAAIRTQLIAPARQPRVYAEFNREALLQADSAAKASFLSTMVQNGLMTRNEGRAKLNLSRMEGADDLTVQVNLAPLDTLGAQGEPAAALREQARAWLGIEDKAK